jgi:hypothetical protein
VSLLSGSTASCIPLSSSAAFVLLPEAQGSSSCRAAAPNLPAICPTLCSDTDAKLSRKVEDLEDVRFLVNVLNEVSASPPDVTVKGKLAPLLHSYSPLATPTASALDL